VGRLSQAEGVPVVDHEWMFYEVMWRAWGRGAAYPLPWWAVNRPGVSGDSDVQLV